MGNLLLNGIYQSTLPAEGIRSMSNYITDREMSPAAVCLTDCVLPYRLSSTLPTGFYLTDTADTNPFSTDTNLFFSPRTYVAITTPKNHLIPLLGYCISSSVKLGEITGRELESDRANAC